MVIRGRTRGLDEHRRLAVAVIGLAILAAGCASSSVPAPLTVAAGGLSSELVVVAEGPCSRLDVQAVGDRRLLVYGETGYDLRGWLPGDELAAAQSFVELRGDRALRNHSLLRGLPVDEGGYVRGDLSFGANRDHAAWLLVGTTRYAAFSRGALFDRSVVGYEYRSATGWHSVDTEPVELPPQAGQLPEIDRATACGQAALRFVPLASATTPTGGVLVAGRCDDADPVNHRDTRVMVAHGRPHASSWEMATAPDTDVLDGIVSLDLHAPADDEAYLVVYEPFRPVAERSAYLARFDGSRWRTLDAPPGGLMSVAGTGDGGLWLAAGRDLLRREPDGRYRTVPLGPLRFARSRAATPGPLLQVHTVRAFANGEVWVAASYRVGVRHAGSTDLVPVWASALWSNRRLSRPLYCDAREPAHAALSEIE